MLALIREMSLRHLRHSPFRSLLVVLGIALGVAVFVAAQATSQGMLTSFEQLIARVAGHADLKVTGNQSGIDSALVAQIAGIDGVEHVAASLEATTSFVDDRQPLLILGIDFLGDTFFLPFEPEPGQKDIVDDPLAFANDPTAILISKTLATRRGLKQDSPLELLTSDGVKTFHVRGILEDSGAAASFGGQMAVMFLDAAQVSFARGTLVDNIDVAVRKGEDVQDVARRISAVVGQFARVERPQQAGERLRALAMPLRNGLRLSGLIALLVGMFIIYNAIGVSVAQRRKEVGLLRALGVIARNVVAHFCIEAALLSVPGIILGLLLARRLLIYTQSQTLEVINQAMVSAPVEPKITLSHAIQGACAGIVISLCAAFIPARRGAAMDPVAALRPSAVRLSGAAVPYLKLGIAGCVLMCVSWLPAYCPFAGSSVLATLLNVSGAGLLAPAIIIVLRRMLISVAEAIFGISGRFGLDNVERDLGRSSINVLALMVAVSMSISVSGWLISFESSIRDWFDQIAAHDLTVTAGSPFIDDRHVPLLPSAVERIAKVEGIEAVKPIRVINQWLGDQTLALSSYDSQTAAHYAMRKHKGLRIIDGKSPIGPEELKNKPLIVISENAAKLFKLTAGDKLTLSTPTGPHDFEVRAVIVDYAYDQGAAYIDQRFYREMWKDNSIDYVELFLKPNADPSRVAQQVRESMGGGQGVFVTTTTELKNQFFAAVRKGFSYTRSLELIVLIIALLGVVGTMVSAVIDRTREIGVLRAIGCTRGQVTTSLVIEAAFLGLCSVVGGILAGTVQCLLFLQTIAADEAGWHLSFVFPFAGALRIGLLVIATSTVAGLLPGLRASRLEVKEALAYE